MFFFVDSIDHEISNSKTQFLPSIEGLKVSLVHSKYENKDKCITCYKRDYFEINDNSY